MRNLIAAVVLSLGLAFGQAHAANDVTCADMLEVAHFFDSEVSGDGWHMAPVPYTMTEEQMDSFLVSTGYPGERPDLMLIYLFSNGEALLGITVPIVDGCALAGDFSKLDDITLETEGPLALPPKPYQILEQLMGNSPI